jgi:hypothetical protein
VCFDLVVPAGEGFATIANSRRICEFAPFIASPGHRVRSVSRLIVTVGYGVTGLARWRV